MSLERIWAGWRAAYVGELGEGGGSGGSGSGGAGSGGTGSGGTGSGGCVMCGLVEAGDDAAAYVVARTRHSVAALNAYPYSSGHCMVMPRRHVAGFGSLDAEESADLWALALDALAAIDVAYRPDGANLGANVGRAAGAGIPDHVHLHVLPRWAGDSNFMTAVAEVRVLPEPLGVTWERLRDAWGRVRGA